jgi:hypothetical protein
MGDKSLTCKTGHGRRRRDEVGEKEKEARREWRRIKKD